MDFESQFTPLTDDDKVREQVLHQIKLQADAWPEMVALWAGMVKQLENSGWTEYAARSLVLANVTMHNYAIIANIPMAFENGNE